MNYLMNRSELLLEKMVFEPFAGSGVLGLMALKVGARSVDWLDINPRAVRFQRDNAERNDFAADRYRCFEGSIETFEPVRKYDLLFANPPFVPTPEGIEGTITSNGGRDGNRWVGITLERLEEFLEASGEAFLYVFQLVRDGEPLVVDWIRRCVVGRPVELTPTQSAVLRFQDYEQAYLDLFPSARKAIARWRSSLIEAHGEDLVLNHYVLHIGAQSGQPTSCAIVDNLAEKFGEGLYLQFGDSRQLAYGRVFENVLRS